MFSILRSSCTRSTTRSFPTRFFANKSQPPSRPPPRMSPAARRAARGGSSGKNANSTGANTASDEGGSAIPRSALAVAALVGAGAWWYTSLDDKGNITGVLKTASDQIDTLAIAVMGDDSKPNYEKLLPDVDQRALGPDGNHPPVLVIAMEDTLVHTTWDSRNGFRVAKRPGVDAFLEFLCPFYEIVFISELPYAVGSEMMMNLDRGRGLHHHMVCKEGLVKSGRKLIKDLSYLNRDLNQVIVIDSNKDALVRQPENLCQVAKYDNPKEQRQDTELTELQDFLYTLATQRNPDFREVLKRYGNNNIGAQYKAKIEEHHAKMAQRRSIMKR